jgi:uncharacterized protein (TIGR02145 family)
MKTKNRIWFCQFIVIGLAFILTNSCSKDEGNNNPSSITDKDGNVYTSVTIGTQVWMVENLKTTKYNDGTEIPNVTTGFDALITPGYCWYNNDVANKLIYGALYNWFAVYTGKLCPTGWHVPSRPEVTTLQTYLGGESVGGGKLKETGTTHWTSPNTGATNESGFTALPGGYRPSTFMAIHDAGYWWNSTETSTIGASFMIMWCNNSNITITQVTKADGMSVRCIKD